VLYVGVFCGSILELQTVRKGLFVISIISSRQILEQYLKLGFKQFLPTSFSVFHCDYPVNTVVHIVMKATPVKFLISFPVMIDWKGNVFSMVQLSYYVHDLQWLEE